MSKYQIMAAGDSIEDVFDVYGMKTEGMSELDDYIYQMHYIGHSNLEDALKDAKIILSEAPELRFVVILCNGRLSQMVSGASGE